MPFRNHKKRGKRKEKKSFADDARCKSTGCVASGTHDETSEHNNFNKLRIQMHSVEPLMQCK